jgi:ATP-dependent RNA helicase DDX18/HAS1
LQSYASYSLKKIFDVKKLDLVKVGKAFGFTVPPRVNVNMGDRASGLSASSQGKRKRDGLDAEIDSDGDDAEHKAMEREVQERVSRGGGKQRRTEQLGKKQVEKEIYRKDKVRRVDKDGKQWGR